MIWRRDRLASIQLSRIRRDRVANPDGLGLTGSCSILSDRWPARKPPFADESSGAGTMPNRSPADPFTPHGICRSLLTRSVRPPAESSGVEARNWGSGLSRPVPAVRIPRNESAQR